MNTLIAWIWIFFYKKKSKTNTINLWRTKKSVLALQNTFCLILCQRFTKLWRVCCCQCHGLFFFTLFILRPLAWLSHLKDKKNEYWACKVCGLKRRVFEYRASDTNLLQTKKSYFGRVRVDTSGVCGSIVQELIDERIQWSHQNTK